MPDITTDDGTPAVPGGREIVAEASRRIWLASYPRSGNTLLRCILHQCFGLPSTSVYGPGDLGRNAALERYAGHFNAKAPPPELASDKPWLVKTHRRPRDNAPAIYVVRDPRPATVSFWEFQRRRRPLRAIISGDPHGTWSSHVAAWQPLVRPNTLLLRYEEMVDGLPSVLERLSDFLGLPVLSWEAPPRADIASVDGRWVREPSDWRLKVTPADLRLLEAINGEMLSMIGYQRHVALPGERPSSTRPTQRARPIHDEARGRLQASCTAAFWLLRGRIRRRLARLLATCGANRGVHSRNGS